jgi:ABC-type phosphate/phosphonate transport system substrate-binding protein
MRTYFREEAKLDVEVTLFLNYVAQVEALLAKRIDIAWNTNLAYLQTERWGEGACAPLAMRDTDLNWTTKIIALRGGPIESIEQLRGKKLALGSRDSGHAAVLPVHFLAKEGLVEGKDYESIRFDLDLGKHGDTGTSELDVLKAVLEGRADAGAVGSPFFSAIHENELVPKGSITEVWTSPPYHHCMFNARVDLPDEQRKAFVDALMKMSWDNPVHRPILEAEGLKAWIEPHTDGYDALRDAAGEVGLLDRG